MKIYVITYGDYSEYSIHSVWTSKAKAKHMADKMNKKTRGYYDVEEYEANTDPEQPLTSWKATWQLTSGETVKSAEVEYEEVKNVAKAIQITSEHISVTTDTKDKAFKILCDTVAKMRALDEGL